MATYKITAAKGPKVFGHVTADGFEAAARAAASKFFKRKGVVRVTGDPGKSGIFAATTGGKGPDKGATVLEERFHVM